MSFVVVETSSGSHGRCAFTQISTSPPRPLSLFSVGPLHRRDYPPKGAHAGNAWLSGVSFLEAGDKDVLVCKLLLEEEGFTWVWCDPLEVFWCVVVFERTAVESYEGSGEVPG